MSATDRQNRLLLAKDWTKVYQSFRNADFQSYDFENIRRSMIDYLRQNFPEDFNDYTESSEYLALVDLIAYLGQSIAFRVDLNARENFLELAERRDSVLRLARMLGYNAKRCQTSSGLLKIVAVQTTENVLDSNGKNLSNSVVSWNDSSNANWYDQFISVLNAAFSPTQQFGNPSDKGVIYNIPTEQYRFNGANSNVPVYNFSKIVNGSNMDFEVCSTTFNGENYIYEEPPKIANRMACVYKNDGQGAASSNTGFFFYFTQGTLNQGTFTITQPSTSETIDIDSSNINNTDVWLYRLDTAGAESELWTQVPSLSGNNIIYNSLNKDIKNIYNVITRAGDRVSIAFSDGVFGTLPLGSFRAYYRISNGLSYSINPQDIRGVTLTIPYFSHTGQTEQLTVTLSLQTTVANSATTETNDSVKSNAPATYYTQNRMITGEDYNISPLSASQEIVKIKAVNRSSSGISRYLDLIDPTGKYSKTNLFADDGIVYQEVFATETSFTANSRTEIQSIIYNKIFNLLKDSDLRNFYYSKFTNINTSLLDIAWYNVVDASGYASGYLGSSADSKPYLVSSYTNTALKYVNTGSLIKFEAPVINGVQQCFDRKNGNKLIPTTTPARSNTSSYIWAEVVSLSGDGTGNGTGVLTTGEGPISLNDNIPTGAIATRVIPVWRTVIDSTVVTTMIDLIANKAPFGLRYDINTQAWAIVFQSNLDPFSPFSLNKQGDLSNLQLDSSWLLLFTTDTITYSVKTRKLRYVFESSEQVRFYFDPTDRVYDNVSGVLLKDIISVLSINTQPGSAQPYTFNQDWKVVNQFIGADGYVDTKKLIVTFVDKDNTDSVKDPDTFENLVAANRSNLNLASKYIILERYTINQGQDDYKYVTNNDSKVIILETQPKSFANYKDGQYFYFIDADAVGKYDATASTVKPSLDYQVFLGRDELKFQYTHNASDAQRIDPGMSNIIDVFVLTQGYDTVFRQWLNGVVDAEPLPPSSSELNDNIAPKLNLIKSISDEIVYHPVKYKVLFGPKAEKNLQAQFKVITNKSLVVSDNDIKTQILSAINKFFALNNWDFGDKFYFTEMSSYVTQQLAPYIVNFVIVPTGSSMGFGGLFEITAGPDEIFISGATIENIDIVPAITPTVINSLGDVALKSNVVARQALTSSPYGSTNV